MPRQSSYSAQTVDTICERLSAGDPLAVICRDADMPGLRTVYDWADADAAVAARIARARDEGEEAIAVDCLDIADDKDDAPASRKVRVETRLKLLSKWNPRKWGDRLALAGDENDPLRIVQAMDETQLEAKLAVLLGKVS